MLNVEQARLIAADFRELAEKIGIPADRWVNRCHEVSLALLKTGAFGPGRVARGLCEGVIGQHSWIVLGSDVYAGDAVIVDATHPVRHELYATSTDADDTPIMVSDSATGQTHFPHGRGSIWNHGRPAPASGTPIELAPREPLSLDAKRFLKLLGPLDRQGWAALAHAPMQDWPSGEIIAAMDDTEELQALIPIDILGMVTSRNPGGLYLVGDPS